MTDRQRIIDTVNGRQVDWAPGSFWLHFPEEVQSLEACVTAHIDFFENTGTGIRKIMNENLVPHDNAPTTGSEWGRIKAFPKNAAFIQNEIELVKRIVEKNDGQGVLLLTIHGIVASAWHARGGPDGYETGRDALAAMLREDAKAFYGGLDAISDALTELARQALEAGVDGIYYATLGGEKSLFTDEEFERYIKPHDVKVLEAAAGSPCFNVLHLCKDNLNLARFKGYPGCKVVNWAVHEPNPTLLEGYDIFPGRAVLGGYDDRAGVLVNGNTEEIRQFGFEVLESVQGRPFLLGADCTLPTEIEPSRIRAAVEAPRAFAQRG